MKCFLSSWNFELLKMANSMRVMNKSVVIRMCLVLSVLCGADAWKWNRFKFLIGHDLLPANPETSMTTVQFSKLIKIRYTKLFNYGVISVKFT